jgi:ElaB/YqjD/DUF883 family membrane-anchored ribosome-binding protein
VNLNVTPETEKLMKDLRAVVVDTEDLIKATAGQTGERIEKVRARAEESLRAARQRVQSAGGDMQAAAEGAARQLDGQVRDNAWTAIAVAAGAGLIAGILLARK